MVMGWVLRGAKMVTVPVGKFRRCAWTGLVASVVMAVMVRSMSCFSLFPAFLCCPGVRACRSSAGARFARCSLSVVSCAIVSHVMPPVFVFRVFLASAARLSCGMMGVGKKSTVRKSNGGGSLMFEMNEWGR